MYVDTINYGDKNASYKLSESLKRTGFALITDHPISKDLIKQTYNDWIAFFQQPPEYKNKFLYDPLAKGTQEGYFSFRSENAKGYKAKDLKEFYHYTTWGRVPDGPKASSEKLYQELSMLGQEFLSWIENHIPQAIRSQFSIPLSEMVKDSEATIMRSVHYPPLSGQEEKEAIRAAAHEDINFLTVYPYATAPGLQVMDVYGNWHDIQGDAGTIIVNVGDMLEHLTQRYYRSTSHRVINPPHHQNEARHSLVLFLHPQNKMRLSEKHTALSYLHERLREQGLLTY